MDETIYTSLLWRTVSSRARARDGNRCTVARLIGGDCGGVLHGHHIVPVSEGGAAFDLDNVGTVCAVHHPTWEALRRRLVEVRERRRIRCRHQHRSREAREQCERRLARRRSVAA